VVAFSTLYGSRLDRELGTDDSTILFTTGRRKAAVNEAQETFARLTKCLKRRSTVTLSSTSAEVNLLSTLSDFVEYDVEQPQFRYTNAAGTLTILAGDDLPRRDPAWLNRIEPGWQDSASTGEQWPSVWYDRPEGGNRYIGLWPAPSTGSSASMELLVPYVARPVAMTSDTAEPFTVNSSVRTDIRPYHQALPHYAAHLLEKLRRDDQASQNQLQQFLAYVSLWIQDQRKKGGTMLTFANNYFSRGRDRGVDPRR
jgi:hypothetical protein